jgi:hypothetical protein
MPYVILLLAAALIVAWHAPTPSAKELRERSQQEADDQKRVDELRQRFTEELLGLPLKK